MAAKDVVARLFRRGHARQRVDRLKDAVGRRRPAHGALAVQFEPDLAVVLARLLEQPGGGGGHVADVHARQHPPQPGNRLAVEVDAPRVLGRQMRLDAQRSADLAQDRLVGAAERVHAVLRQVPAGRDERAGDQTGHGQRGDRQRLRDLPVVAPADTRPHRGHGQAGGGEQGRSQHHVEAHQPVLELGHHRRGGVAGRPLPEAAVHGRHEIHDPRADGDAEGDNRRGGRVIGERGGGRGQGNREGGVQAVAEHHHRQFRRVDMAAVTAPQSDSQRRRQRRDQPAGHEHQRLGRDPPDDWHGPLHLELERAALLVAGNQANGDKRQQERRREFAGAEGRRPDAHERREGLAHAFRRAAVAAEFRIGADGVDERHANQRTHQRQHHPPGARGQEFTPFLLQQPPQRRSR